VARRLTPSLEDLAEEVRDDPRGHPRGGAGWVSGGDSARRRRSRSRARVGRRRRGSRVARGSRAPRAPAANARARPRHRARPGRSRRTVGRPPAPPSPRPPRHRARAPRAWSPSVPERPHPVDLGPVDVTNPKGGDRAHERQLREAPQLAGSGEPRAVELIEEIGVRVDVDDVEAPARLHAPAERIADRVIAPDRDHQRAALGDRTRRARDALVVGLGGRALDQDVPRSTIVTPTRRSRSASTSYQPSAPWPSPATVDAG
jgi:hypothetical protein